MLALLKLIPTKDWCYGSAIAALVAGFALFTWHERSVGAQAVKDADARTAAAQVIHNAEVETRAHDLTNASVVAYRATVAAPPAADAPSLRVCEPSSPDPVPENGGADRGDDVPPASAADRTPSYESSVERGGVDLGPALDKLHSDADAKIVLLQSYIKICQSQGMCQK